MAFATHLPFVRNWLDHEKCFTISGWQIKRTDDKPFHAESFPVRPEMHFRKVNQVHFDFMLALRLQIKGLSHQAQIFSANKTLKWKESIETYSHQGQNSFNKNRGPWIFFPFCLIEKTQTQKERIFWVMSPDVVWIWKLFTLLASKYKEHKKNVLKSISLHSLYDY